MGWKWKNKCTEDDLGDFCYYEITSFSSLKIHYLALSLLHNFKSKIYFISNKIPLSLWIYIIFCSFENKINKSSTRIVFSNSTASNAEKKSRKYTISRDKVPRSETNCSRRRAWKMKQKNSKIYTQNVDNIRQRMGQKKPLSDNSMKSFYTNRYINRVAKSSRTNSLNAKKRKTHNNIANRIRKKEK